MVVDIEAPQLTLREHSEPSRPNIYDPIVKQVLEAGPGQDGVILVPTPALKKHKRELQKAANAVNRSARIIEETSQGDSSTEVVFQIKEKTTRTRKPKGEAPASDESVPEITDAA